MAPRLLLRRRGPKLVPVQSYSCLQLYRHYATIVPAKALEKLLLRSGEVRDVGDVRIKSSAKDK